MNKLLILFAVLTISCGNTVNKSTETQDKAENTEKDQQDMLIGEFKKEDLQKEPFSKWFSPAYENYTPNTSEMNTINENINDYEIKVLMGTWCGDSKREVPKLLTIKFLIPDAAIGA